MQYLHDWKVFALYTMLKLAYIKKNFTHTLPFNLDTHNLSMQLLLFEMWSRSRYLNDWGFFSDNLQITPLFYILALVSAASYRIWSLLRLSQECIPDMDTLLRAAVILSESYCFLKVSRLIFFTAIRRCFFFFNFVFIFCCFSFLGGHDSVVVGLW